jgi:sugar lactone lactonase YvrE
MRRVQSCLAVVVLLTALPLYAQSKAKVQNVPEIPYDSVPNALKLPDNLYLGEGIGIATNSKGHVFAYTRSARTRLFEFDQNGTFVKEIGEGLYGFLFAHAVRVDKDDNIWAVDEGSNMVIKFDPNGKVLMLIGRRPEAVEGLEAAAPPGTPPPNAQPYALARPTDIGWDPQGNIYISDGYTNSRVVKYDKFGKFVKSVGGARGSAPSQFNTPHGLQVDAKGNVYVADRGNARIQVFDSNLTLRAIYDHVGNPWTLCITPGPHQYLYSSNSYPDSNPAAARDITGEIYKMELDGTVVGKFGKAGKQLKEFATTHGIDCRNENELWISEITAWRAQKIILHPQQTPARPTSTSAAR